jgi:phosphosulfolactate phosphohydrolase-like enzyme
MLAQGALERYAQITRTIATAMKVSIQSLLEGARNASGAVAVIDTFRAFTTVVAASARADRLYAASLVTAEATFRALHSGSPGEVTIVAMAGNNGTTRTDEDELTAIHLRNRLEGRPGDKQAVRRIVLAGGEVQRFYDPARIGHRARRCRHRPRHRPLRFCNPGRLPRGAAGGADRAPA